MAADLICAVVGDNTLLINRRTNRIASMEGDNWYAEIQKLLRKQSIPPEWLKNALVRVGGLDKRNNSIRLHFKTQSRTRLVRATYDITQECNFHCRHCYLGRKEKDVLSLADKLRVIDVIDEAGCVFLQFTGGEVTTDKHFPAIYKYAYEKGFVTSVLSNGRRLGEPLFQKLFMKYPPERITVSLYGGSEESYRQMTMSKGSFTRVINSLKQSARNLIRVDVSLLVASFNIHELSVMKRLLKDNNLSYRLYDRLSPRLNGDPAPVALNVKRPKDRARTPDTEHAIGNIGQDGRFPCQAGSTFIHINHRGHACVCKVARQPSFSVLKEGARALAKILRISNKVLHLDASCLTCAAKMRCKVCPPSMQLYRKAGMATLLCSNPIACAGL